MRTPRVAHVVARLGGPPRSRPVDLGAFHAPRALSRDDDELGAQLGRQVQRLAAEKGFAPTEALAEVAEATKDALSGGRALTKNELHEELRRRVNEDLMPWCRGCKSHHVAPMLWRYGTIQAGARLDSERRYLLGKPGRAPAAAEAVRRFLHFYGPSTVGEFADWAGVAKAHAERLWARVEGEPRGGPRGEADGVGAARATAPGSSPRRRPGGSGSSRPETPTYNSPTGRSWPPMRACASGCSARSPAPEWCCATGGSPGSGGPRRRARSSS